MTDALFPFAFLTDDERNNIAQMLLHSDWQLSYEDLTEDVLRFQIPTRAIHDMISYGGLRETIDLLRQAPDVSVDVIAEVDRQLHVTQDTSGWPVFAGLLGTRLVPVAKMRRWLRTVPSVREIERFYEDRITLAIATEVKRRHPNVLPVLVEVLRASRQHNLTDEEAITWLNTPIIRPHATPFSEIVDGETLRFWQTVLDKRAPLWAAAGFSVHEAVRADAAGEFDEQMLLTMAALRDGDGLRLLGT